MLAAGGTSAAGLRQPHGVGRRLRVLGLADIVHAVAIDAGGDGFIAGRQLLAMHAGLVLSELIDALLRPELVYQCRVAVATGAELRDSRTRRLPHKSTRGAHRN